jgi:hypothetical protein
MGGALLFAIVAIVLGLYVKPITLLIYGKEGMRIEMLRTNSSRASIASAPAE